MSPAVQPLLLFLLCRDLFNYALVTAGSVLDTAIDTADGRRADLYLFHDLVIGAAAKQQFTEAVSAGGLKVVDAGSLKRARELEALGFLQITLAAGKKVSWANGFGVVA